MLGMENEIQTEPIYSNDGFHISNEIWMIDNKQNHQCLCGLFGCSGPSWIEAGYVTKTHDSRMWYYWGDCRMNIDGSANDHWMSLVPSGDNGGYNWHVIYQSAERTWQGEAGD